MRQEERHGDGPKSHPSIVDQFESHADSISESSKESSGDSDASQDSTSSNQQSEQQKLPEESRKRTRKRKRSDEDDSIERRALQRLANYDENNLEIDNSKPNGLDHEAPNTSDVESEVDQDADEEPSNQGSLHDCRVHGTEVVGKALGEGSADRGGDEES